MASRLTAKKVSVTRRMMAPATPQKTPSLRWRGGRFRQASAITTALSPLSRMSIRMICRTAIQNCGLLRSMKGSSGFVAEKSDAQRKTDFSSLPISAGLRVTLIPHSSMTASFSAAVPLPPEMIAPAWPMRLPGGALTPAMKPTIRFLVRAADLADHHHRFRRRIGVEELEHIEMFESVDRIAADANCGRLAQSQLRQLSHRFVGERAGSRYPADRSP